MKIAITSTGPDLESNVDPRFGRCSYFLIIDSDSMDFEAIQNTNQSAGGGAGIQSAQLISQKDVDTVLTGNCGPNAYQTLSAAGINIMIGVSGSVREAVEKFKAGEFSKIDGPNVGSHSGMKGGQTGGMGGGRGQA